MKLTETVPEQPNLTQEQIDFLEDHVPAIWTWTPEGINVHGDAEISRRVKVLPVKFNEIRGDFNFASGGALESLVGSPNRVGGYFRARCPRLKSYEGGPSYIGEVLDLVGSGIKRFPGIHKQLKYVGEAIEIGPGLRSHLLGFALVHNKANRHFMFYTGDVPRLVHDLIEGELFKPYSERDVHAVQEQLIEAGLTEYAKL